METQNQDKETLQGEAAPATQELLEEGCGYPQCRLLFAAENNGQNRSLYI